MSRQKKAVRSEAFVVDRDSRETYLQGDQTNKISSQALSLWAFLLPLDHIFSFLLVASIYGDSPVLRLQPVGGTSLFFAKKLAIRSLNSSSFSWLSGTLAALIERLPLADVSERLRLPILRLAVSF